MAQICHEAQLNLYHYVCIYIYFFKPKHRHSQFSGQEECAGWHEPVMKPSGMFVIMCVYMLFLCFFPGPKMDIHSFLGKGNVLDGCNQS